MIVNFRRASPMSTELATRASPANQFANEPATLRQMIADVLKYARELGSTACEAQVSEGSGQTLTRRNDDVDTIEYNRDKSMGVSVYIGQRRGHASRRDL